MTIMEWGMLWLLLTAFLIRCTSEEFCIDTNVNLVQGYNNKRIIDLDPALWTTNLSLAMCLEKCYHDSLCLSVNVAPDTNTCVGFKQKFEGRTSDTEAVQGYRVYETLSTDCSTVDHCSTYFGPSHCKENLCRCNIGYSLDGFHCRTLTECPTFSNVIREFPGYVKWHHDILTYTNQTLSSCGDLCVNNADCQTADFQVSTGGCWLDNNNWYDAVAGGRGSSSDFIYIQKECNW